MESKKRTKPRAEAPAPAPAVPQTPAPRATVLRQFYSALESCGFCARHDTHAPIDLLWISDGAAIIWTRTVLGHQLGPHVDAALELQLRIDWDGGASQQYLIALTPSQAGWQMSGYALCEDTVLRSRWDPFGAAQMTLGPDRLVSGFIIQFLKCAMVDSDARPTEADLDAEAEAAHDECSDHPPIDPQPPVPTDPDQEARMEAAWYGCCALAREVYRNVDLHFNVSRSAVPQYRVEHRTWGRPVDFWFGHTVYTIRRAAPMPEQSPFSVGGLIQPPDEAADRASTLHQGSLPSVWRALRSVQADQNRE